MSIHKAEIKDASEVLSVINKSNAESYRKIIPPEYFKEPVFTFNDILRKFEQMSFYIYELKGKAVGVAALQTESNHLGSIRFVYILPEHQRKGVGSSLVTYIEREATKLGFRKLRVPYVNVDAYWAVKFYKKLGYKIADKLKNPWGYDLFFEKVLS
jgi:N-acetylglutamate synthase-like GNAT family acetyltransferase